MACALAQSGRHTVTAYAGPPASADELRRAAPELRLFRDTEEILADPAIEAVIVASPPTHRADHLRRALQSERHVLCVCPVDQTPDIAYETAMIQKDVGVILLPLLPLPLHPALIRMADWYSCARSTGTVGLLRVEYAQSDVFRATMLARGKRVAIPGWEILQRLGGDITEVSALADGEEIVPGQPFLISGRFERAGIFEVSFLPTMHEVAARMVAGGSEGTADLVFPEGFTGPAKLSLRPNTGSTSTEEWNAWDPWKAMCEVFDIALADKAGNRARLLPISWQLETKCLELDDAARRSVERRRVSMLEYPEASEEVGFKGTMTLVGCAMLWVILLAVILSRWVPWLGWLVIPVLVLFLMLQLLRWLLPRSADR